MSGNINGMKQHISTLGVLFIVFGAFGLLAAIFLLVVMEAATSIIGTVGVDDPAAAVVAPILGLAVGIGFVKFQNWARIGGLILSAVNVLNCSLGTALGFYGIWTLQSKEAEVIFT